MIKSKFSKRLAWKPRSHQELFVWKKWHSLADLVLSSLPGVLLDSPGVSSPRGLAGGFGGRRGGPVVRHLGWKERATLGRASGSVAASAAAHAFSPPPERRRPPRGPPGGPGRLNDHASLGPDIARETIEQFIKKLDAELKKNSTCHFRRFTKFHSTLQKSSRSIFAQS